MMKKIGLIYSLIFTFPMLVACGSEPKPVEPPLDPQERIAISEQIRVGSRSSDWTEVRQVAAEYVKAEMPNSTVNGISVMGNYKRLYLVAVDIVTGQQRRTVDLTVRLFFKESGETYWKAEPLSGEVVQALSKIEVLKSLR